MMMETDPARPAPRKRIKLKRESENTQAKSWLLPHALLAAAGRKIIIAGAAAERSHN
jgi:hypothetical protein